MLLTLKDGSTKEYSESKSVYDIALDSSEGLARKACAGLVNGEVKDLRTVIDTDAELAILTPYDKEGLKVLRHTVSHVMAEAVKRIRPDAKVTIGQATEEGFYYDFDTDPFSREDLDDIEAEMYKIVKEGNKLERFELPRNEAIKFMEDRNEPFKVELINDLPEDAIISFYSQGDGFTDLCAGPHLMNTNGIEAFKLTSSSMAYWRGDANKARLQRIYGTAFGDMDDAKAYFEPLTKGFRIITKDYDTKIKGTRIHKYDGYKVKVNVTEITLDFIGDEIEIDELVEFKIPADEMGKNPYFVNYDVKVVSKNDSVFYNAIDGTFVANKNGKAKVTISINSIAGGEKKDGLRYYFEAIIIFSINVKAPIITQTDVSLAVNKSKKIKLKNVSKSKAVSFTTDNANVVTVNEKGVMKAVASGNAKIAIKIEDDPNEYYVNVTVK